MFSKITFTILLLFMETQAQWNMGIHQHGLSYGISDLVKQVSNSQTPQLADWIEFRVGNMLQLFVDLLLSVSRDLIDPQTLPLPEKECMPIYTNSLNGHRRENTQQIFTYLMGEINLAMSDMEDMKGSNMTEALTDPIFSGVYAKKLSIYEQSGKTGLILSSSSGFVPAMRALLPKGNEISQKASFFDSNRTSERSPESVFHNISDKPPMFVESVLDLVSSIANNAISLIPSRVQYNRNKKRGNAKPTYGDSDKRDRKPVGTLDYVALKKPILKQTGFDVVSGAEKVLGSLLPIEVQDKKNENLDLIENNKNAGPFYEDSNKPGTSKSSSVEANVVVNLSYPEEAEDGVKWITDPKKKRPLVSGRDGRIGVRQRGLIQTLLNKLNKRQKPSTEEHKHLGICLLEYQINYANILIKIVNEHKIMIATLDKISVFTALTLTEFAINRIYEWVLSVNN